MRVPGIGGFSPVDTVSWVRAPSPSELVYRQQTTRPFAPVSTSASSPPQAAAAVEARSELRDAALLLHRTAEALANAAPPDDAAPQPVAADDTIASAYPGVTGGTIVVNGHSISVTPGITTVREVVAALDTIPGLFAAVDTATGTIVVAGLMADKKLEITDSTGLLHALGLQTGIIVPDRPTAAIAVATNDTDDTADRASAVGKAVGRVNHAMQKLANGPRELDRLRIAANGVVQSAVASLDAETKGAFRVEASNGSLRLSVDADRLSGALRSNPNAMSRFLSDELAKPLEAVLDHFDETTGAPRSPGAAPEKGALALARPPVELFETALAHAGMDKG